MRDLHRVNSALLAVLIAAASACTGTGSAPSDSTTTSGPTTSGPITTLEADGPQQLLAAAREAYGAPGALAVVRTGPDEWSGVSGTADLAGSAVTSTTRFRIASITKPIVATLILDAVQRGELSLDAVVGDLLPGVVRPEPPVTVRMLLNHTSGIFDIGNEGDPIADIAQLSDPSLMEEAQALVATYEAGGTGIASGRLFIALAETHDRYFDPGAGFHYSNTNYQLAAMVLEHVTGRTFADLLAERIGAPLGLEHMTVAPPDISSPEFRGYGTSIDDGSVVDVTDDLVAFGNGGNGGIIANADELLTVMQAIVSGELVDGDLLEEMRTPTAQSDRSYGLGLATYHLSCGTFLGHEGAVNGTVSIAVVSPDGDRGVVAAMNLLSGSDPHLTRLADGLLCGQG